MTCEITEVSILAPLARGALRSVAPKLNNAQIVSILAPLARGALLHDGR